MMTGESLGAMVETGSSGEIAESHGRRDFGSGKDAALMVIRQAWQERGRVGGGGARTEKGRGKTRNTGMMGQRQVTPRWIDDPVKRHNRRRWRGCQGRRGMPLPEGHRTAEREGGAVPNYKRRILGSGRVTVRGWNSTTS